MRTNTPLQALNLMNDTTFLEAARQVGQRMMEQGGPDPERRLRYGFRLVTARTPSPQELEIVRDNLRFSLDYFSTKPERATTYLTQGDAPLDRKLNPLELAAYTSAASLLLNLDETITKE
jgi:hypothetical protein